MVSHKTRAERDAIARRRLTIFRAKIDGTCYYCEQSYSPGDLVAWVDDKNGIPRHYRCACQEVGIVYRADGVVPI